MIQGLIIIMHKIIFTVITPLGLHHYIENWPCNSLSFLPLSLHRLQDHSIVWGACIPLYRGSESSTQRHVKWPCSHWAKHLIFDSTVQALEVAWLHWPPFLESEWNVPPHLRAVTHFQRFPHALSFPAPCLLLWQNSVMPLPFRSYVLQLSVLTLHPHAINHITF